MENVDNENCYDLKTEHEKVLCQVIKDEQNNKFRQGFNDHGQAKI